MGVVTKIEELSRTRSKVYLDEEFAFVLYKGELRRYHIEVGGELANESEEEIRKEILPKRAKLRSMNLLKNREYTEKQLRDKLRQGGYPEAAVEEAVQYVKSFRYVDDVSYAEHYILCHLSDKSGQRIRMDLLRKGISKEIIDQQMERLGSKEDEAVLLSELLKKKHYSPDMAVEEQRKIFAFLLRKGFQGEDIREAMKMT